MVRYSPYSPRASNMLTQKQAAGGGQNYDGSKQSRRLYRVAGEDMGKRRRARM